MNMSRVMTNGVRALMMVLKNLLAFIAGAVVGVLGVLVFARQLLEHAITKDVGLGIIAVAPAVLIIYATLFGAAGGLLGIIAYNFWIRRRRKS